MQEHYTKKISYLILWCLLMISCTRVIGQTVIGMGTKDPNPNAVLELFSENFNQGFLAPRLTTEQRTANSFTSQLSAKDNGLLVFDTDEGSFFYWFDGKWYQGSNTEQNLSSVLTQGADATGRTISNLGAPLSANDAATKAYVDASKTLPEGNILIGNSSHVAQPLNAKAAGSLLIGNGLTVASVSISGDLVLLPDGTFTIKDLVVTSTKIADDAITKEKINADVAGNGLGQNTDGSLEIKVAGGGLQLTSDQLTLNNLGNGQVLIGNGSQVNARNISGDVSLANDGKATTEGLQGRTVSNIAPANNQVLAWNGTQWLPQSLSAINAGASWHSGTLVPNSSYPTAVNGDFYYKTDTQVIYRKEGLTWVTLGKLVNSNASTPTTYTPGNNLDPPNSLGSVGDFYIKQNGNSYMKTGVNRWEIMVNF